MRGLVNQMIQTKANWEALKKVFSRVNQILVVFPHENFTLKIEISPFKKRDTAIFSILVLVDQA